MNLIRNEPHQAHQMGSQKGLTSRRYMERDSVILIQKCERGRHWFLNEGSKLPESLLSRRHETGEVISFHISHPLLSFHLIIAERADSRFQSNAQGQQCQFEIFRKVFVCDEGYTFQDLVILIIHEQLGLGRREVRSYPQLGICTTVFSIASVLHFIDQESNNQVLIRSLKRQKPECLRISFLLLLLFIFPITAYGQSDGIHFWSTPQILGSNTRPGTRGVCVAVDPMSMPFDIPGESFENGVAPITVSHNFNTIR